MIWADWRTPKHNTETREEAMDRYIQEQDYAKAAALLAALETTIDKYWWKFWCWPFRKHNKRFIREVLTPAPLGVTDRKYVHPSLAVRWAIDSGVPKNEALAIYAMLYSCRPDLS